MPLPWPGTFELLNQPNLPGPMHLPVLPLLLALGTLGTAAAQSKAGGSQAPTTGVSGPAARPATGPTQLSGTVLDGAGRPMPGVNVFLKTTFDGATTDSLGRFAFSTTATGTLPLVFTLIGFEMQATPLALPGGRLALPPRRLRESRASLGTVSITAGAFEASDDKRSAALKPLDIVTTAGALGDMAGALSVIGAGAAAGAVAVVGVAVPPAFSSLASLAHWL